MEQRNQVRKAADMAAVVSCPQFGLFRGQIDNLSLHGMFVRTRNVAICRNAPVTVTFQPRPDQPLLTCSAAGKVVRQGRDGIGIRFTGLDSKCVEALQGLIDQLPPSDDEIPEPKLQVG